MHLHEGFQSLIQFVSCNRFFMPIMCSASKTTFQAFIVTRAQNMIDILFMAGSYELH